MEFKHVLLLDRQIESRRNTAFLLKLAGIQVTCVEDENEALNWITNRRGSPEPFRLLIMRNLGGAQTRPPRIPDLVRPELGIPVLVVERQREKWSDHPPATIGRSSLFRRCRPEELFEVVKEMIGEPSFPQNGPLTQ